MSRKSSKTSKIESEVFVAVGSNINPMENIPRALNMLAEYVTIRAISKFYRSAALERADQGDFINGVVKILTSYQPRELKFDVLRKIESQLGRLRSADKHAARTIDLDVILYNDVIINEDDLVLPDPAIKIYPFIAVPLLELAPNIVLPGTRVQLSGVKTTLKIDTMSLQWEFTNKLKSDLLGKA